MINSAELGYRNRMDSPAQSVGQVRVYHVLGPSDGLAVVLDNDMWQAPARRRRRSCHLARVAEPIPGESVPSQNLPVLANVLRLPVRAKVDDFGSPANPLNMRGSSPRGMFTDGANIAWKRMIRGIEHDIDSRCHVGIPSDAGGCERTRSTST